MNFILGRVVRESCTWEVASKWSFGDLTNQKMMSFLGVTVGDSVKHTLDILLISPINVSFEAGLGWLRAFLFSFSVTSAHTITHTSYQD